MTLEASPLSNRGYEVPPEYGCSQGKHLKECPNSLTMGDPSRVGFSLVTHPVGARSARTHGY